MVKAISAGVLAAILLVSVASAVWLLPAYRFLRAFQHRLSAATPQDVLRIRSEKAALEVHFYPSPRSRTCLIVVPGLHPEGIEDPRFVAFARSAAEAGFNVVAPDIGAFRRFQITDRPVDQLVRLVESLPEAIPAEAAEKLGMLGVSYGVGPLFAAAADGRVRHRVEFLVSIGGFSDLGDAAQAMMESRRPGTGPGGRVHPWGRLVFAAQFGALLDESVPDAGLVGEIVRLRLNLKDKAAEAKEKRLSPEGRRFLNDIMEGFRGGFSKTLRNRILEILQRQEGRTARLSPGSVLQGLDPRLRIYLLHGRTDDLIPFEQTLELERRLLENGFREVRTLVTGALTHAETASVSGLGERIRLLAWTRVLLTEK